jgi:hypothetical protein
MHKKKKPRIFERQPISSLLNKCRSDISKQHWRMISCHSVHVPLKHDMVKTKSTPPKVTVKMSVDTNLVSIIHKNHKTHWKVWTTHNSAMKPKQRCFLSKESFSSSTANISHLATLPNIFYMRVPKRPRVAVNHKRLKSVNPTTGKCTMTSNLRQGRTAIPS